MSDRPQFVYVIYVRTTAEKLWRALTDAEMSAQYWSGNSIVSDWKVGSPFALKGRPGNVVIGKVLEVDPPRRLAYTFHSQHDGLEKEGPSRVTFELEPLEDQVKLTVTHDEFPVGSEVFGHISRGWPHVLSSLKSFLESGKGMMAPWYRQVASA